MKKIDWKDVWKQAYDEYKKQPWIDGPEKWALYVVIVFLVIFVLI
tara:strand:- start:169 stop:303 length:135 start_codon:yes stop_codon:yes gene_type:complete